MLSKSMKCLSMCMLAYAVLSFSYTDQFALRSALVRPGPSLSFGGSSNLLEAPPKPQIISRPKVPMLDRDIFHKFEQKKALQRSFELDSSHKKWPIIISRQKPLSFSKKNLLDSDSLLQRLTIENAVIAPPRPRVLPRPIPEIEPYPDETPYQPDRKPKIPDWVPREWPKPDRDVDEEWKRFLSRRPMVTPKIQPLVSSGPPPLSTLKVDIPSTKRNQTYPSSSTRFNRS